MRTRFAPDARRRFPDSARPTSRLSRGFVLVAAMLLISIPGCGYRPILSGPAAASRDSGQGADRPVRIVVIALRNDSPEPWLGRILDDAMRREMGARATFDLVEDPDRADVVLQGRVRPLETRSQSFSRFVAALEYSVTLALDLEVQRSSGDAIRLDGEMLSETEVYLASADIEVTRTNRLEALRRISDLLAGRVADSIEIMEKPLDARAVKDAS